MNMFMNLFCFCIKGLCLKRLFKSWYSYQQYLCDIFLWPTLTQLRIYLKHRCFIQYLPMFHTGFNDVSNIYLKHRCFMQYLPMFHTVYTDVSNIYLKHRCFMQYLPMFHTVFTDVSNTDVSYSIYRCFIQYLPMF